MGLIGLHYHLKMRKIVESFWGKVQKHHPTTKNFTKTSRSITFLHTPCIYEYMVSFSLAKCQEKFLDHFFRKSMTDKGPNVRTWSNTKDPVR